MKHKTFELHKEFTNKYLLRLKRLADHESVSCGDRYARWLKEQGKVDCIKLNKDKTKTWFPVEMKEALMKQWKEMKRID